MQLTIVLRCTPWCKGAHSFTSSLAYHGGVENCDLHFQISLVVSCDELKRFGVMESLVAAVERAFIMREKYIFVYSDGILYSLPNPNTPEYVTVEFRFHLCCPGGIR
jgi:hypothetical protein